LGPSIYLSPFFNKFVVKNSTRTQRWCVQLLLEQILAQCWQPVASTKALDPLHWTIKAVLHLRNAIAIGMVSKYCVFFIVVVFPATPGLLGHYGVSSHPMAASKGF
jgi:hypothetical protein